MRITPQQARSFVKLGLRHVCRVDRVSEADVARLATTDLAALIDAIVAHASASPVVDIGRATWRTRLLQIAQLQLALLANPSPAYART